MSWESKTLPPQYKILGHVHSLNDHLLRFQQNASLLLGTVKIVSVSSHLHHQKLQGEVKMETSEEFFKDQHNDINYLIFWEQRQLLFKMTFDIPFTFYVYYQTTSNRVSFPMYGKKRNNKPEMKTSSLKQKMLNKNKQLAFQEEN